MHHFESLVTTLVTLLCSFRVATPFGGFGKAPKPVPVPALQVEPLPDLQEVLQGDPTVNRPSFNRSALGWVNVGSPTLVPVVSLEPAFLPESDDLWTPQWGHAEIVLCFFSGVSWEQGYARVKNGAEGESLACMQRPPLFLRMLTIAPNWKINYSSCTVGRDTAGINRICCILMCIREFYFAVFCWIKWRRTSFSPQTYLKYIFFRCLQMPANPTTWPQVVISQRVCRSHGEGSLEWMMLGLRATVVCKPITYHIVWEAKETCEPL